MFKNYLKIAFRIIKKHKGPNTRFIVTNLEYSRWKFIYQIAYCDRGNSG